MEIIFTLKKFRDYGILFLTVYFLVLISFTVNAQNRIYASMQTTGETGVCVGCVVTNPTNAVNANRSDYAVLNITLGLLIPPSTYQNLIFDASNKPAAGTPVTVKLGTGDQLLSLGVLGAVTVQAFNGNIAVGQPLAAASLISLLSNSNQVEVTFTPQQAYDRVRITLNGGLIGGLSNFYVYGAYYNDSTTGPVACDAAIDELNGVSAGLLGLGLNVGGVNNPQLAIDGNPATASTLNAGVSLTGAYAQQTIVFPGLSVLGDSVKLNLSLPQTLIDAGILTNIQVSTANGTSDNNDAIGLTANVLNVRLLDLSNGNRNVTITYAPTKTFDRVQVRLGGGLANVLSSLNIYEVQRIIARPAISINGIVTNNLTACTGNSVLLTAPAPANTIIRWYDAPTGGNLVFEGSSFQTPVVNATTTYYAEAVRNNCTNTSGRAAATITIVPTPAQPIVANNSVTICAGQNASFTAQNLAGITTNWYSAANGGTLLFSGDNFTTPALTSTTKYYAEAVASGQCTSTARTEVTAIVNPVVTDPVVAQTSLSICSGLTAALGVSSPQTGVTFQWFSSATATAPLFTGNNFITPVLTANQSFFVQASSGTCTSNRVQVDVTVNLLPASPTVTVNSVNAQISAGQTATITASSITPNVTFKWYTQLLGGTAVFEGNPFTTPVLSSNAVYYVEAVSASGCASLLRTRVEINVNPVFSTTCDFVASQTNAVSNLCAGCTISNPNNVVDADITNFARYVIPAGVTGGNISQQLIFADQGVIGDTVRILIRIPNTILSAQLLNGLRVMSYNGATANNDRITFGTNLVALQLLNGGNFGLIKFVPQADYDRVEIELNAGLASLLTTLDVFYATKQVPLPQLSQNNLAVCAGGQAVFTIQNPAAGVTYEWFDAPTGGNLLASGTSFTASNLTASSTFYVQSKRASNNCVNPSRVAAIAVVTPTPATPVLAQNTYTICAGESVNLEVTNAGSGIINWYDAPTGGNLLFTGSTWQTPAVLAATHFYVEAAVGNCISASRTDITVNVNPRPTQPTFVANQVSVCLDSPATLEISNPENNMIYEWFTSPTGGNAVFTGIKYVTPPALLNTTYYVQATNTTTGCVNNGGRSAVNVIVTLGINPPVLNATTISVCNGGTVTLSIVNPLSNQIYNFFDSATGTQPLFTGTSFTLTNVTTNATFYVEAGNATGCISPSRTAVSVSVLALPDLPVVQPAGLSVCAGNITTLKIANPQSDLTYRWYASATGGTPVFTGNEFTTPVLTVNTTYYVDAISSQNCNPSTRLAVTITVNPLPNAPALAADTLTVCAGGKVTFNISAPVAGVIYRWYDSPSKTNQLFEGSTFVTGLLNANTDYYIDASTASGCTSSGVTIAHAVVAAAPSAPLLTNQTVSVCSGSRAVFNISSPQNGLTYNWFDAAAGGNLLFTGTSFTTPAITSNTNYYVEASRNGDCISASRTMATANVNAAPNAAIVSVTGTTVCAGNTTTLTASSTTANTSFNWYFSASGGTPVFSGSNFTTPVLTSNTTYYVESVSSAGCVSATRIAVNVTVGSGTTATPQVVLSGLPVCQNNAATIQIVNPAANTTYNWYISAADPNPIFSGTSFTTPNLSANTTYYVSASSAGSCNPSSRLAVVVTVNPAPDAPVISAQGTTVCAGNTTTLTASSTTANASFNWYFSVSGGMPVFSGSSFTTPVLTSNTIYYVESVSGAGCVSATRTAVTVTVGSRLAAPQVVVSNTTGSSVTFSWNAVNGATGYEISLDNGATFISPGAGASALSYTVTGLSPNQTTTIIVRAKGATDCQQSANSQATTGKAKNPNGDLVWVPNAFTPNGDGHNDILYVYGNSTKQFNFTVYTQWGERIFNSTSTTSGWDGTYKNKIEPVGVYVYYIEVTTNDGQTVKMKGTINLIR